MHAEFYSLLGERVRARRKELRLTQAQVCGDYMTRNMLSRIESGDAHPSLDTLLYISERLNMPMEYFASLDDRNASLYKKIEHIQTIRKLFEDRRYSRCIEYCNETAIDDSEILLIKAESHLKLAEGAMAKCNLHSAALHLEECDLAAKKCPYNSDRLCATVSFYNDLFKSIRENKYPEPMYFNGREILLADREFLIFIFTLSTSKTNSSVLKDAIPSLSDPVYKSFLCAESHICEEKYESAKPYLMNIISAEPDFFTLYFTVRNLELCHKETGDFKAAYEYAGRRLDIIEKFND